MCNKGITPFYMPTIHEPWNDRYRQILGCFGKFWNVQTIGSRLRWSLLRSVSELLLAVCLLDCLSVCLSVCLCVAVFTPGPGPAVYQDGRQTHRGMYNSPAYTMRCLCPPKPPFVTPGPPTYRYEDYPPYMEPRAPIYTMAARTRYPLVR